MSAEFVQPAWSLSAGWNLTSEYNGWKVTLAHRANQSMAMILTSHRVNMFFVFAINLAKRVKSAFIIQTRPKISNGNTK